MNRMSASLRLALALAITLAPLPLSATKTGPEGNLITPLEVDRDDPEMLAARAEARRTLPGFLKLLADPPPGTGRYAIKFPLGGWEHIWVTELRREGDVLIGRLANYPVQEGYKLGQVVRVPIKQIGDWGYRDAKGVMQGHYTTRVIVKRIPPDEAALLRENMGWSE